jgi:response regulator RpfG family c-di-GMP phosphodiesterase
LTDWSFQLGVDDFIAKPFNPIELVLRVKRLETLIPFKESRKQYLCNSILIKDYLCTKYVLWPLSSNLIFQNQSKKQ